MPVLFKFCIVPIIEVIHMSVKSMDRSSELRVPC